MYGVLYVLLTEYADGGDGRVRGMSAMVITYKCDIFQSRQKAERIYRVE